VFVTVTGPDTGAAVHFDRAIGDEAAEVPIQSGVQRREVSWRRTRQRKLARTNIVNTSPPASAGPTLETTSEPP